MKIFKRIILILLTIPLVLIVVYFLGPKAKFEPLIDQQIGSRDFSNTEIDELIENSKATPKLKPDNESRVFWADSTHSKTPWSIIYIHGFSASPEEGDPVYKEFGKRYGMNVYAPLLPGHGQDDKESFLNLKPNELIEAAKEAILVGKSIGDSLLVMSCSTGSTLALYLAGANIDKINALICYSPNIELYDPNAKLLIGPWGKELAYQLIGKYKSWRNPEDPITTRDNYWTTIYRVEGLLSLQYLLSATMTDQILSQVSQPYFIGYYYKNDQEMDKTISIEAIKQFNTISATPMKKKKLVAFANVGAHVMTSPLQSQDVTSVMDSTYVFAENVLGFKPLPQN